MIRKIAKVVLSSRRWTHALTYTWKREHTYSTKFLSKLQTIVNYLEINEKDITVECYVSTRILIFKINVLKAEMVGLVDRWDLTLINLRLHRQMHLRLSSATFLPNQCGALVISTCMHSMCSHTCSDKVVAPSFW